MDGSIDITLLSDVWMKTFVRPALLSGLSNTERMLRWRISGLNFSADFLSLVSMYCLWSSKFRSSFLPSILPMTSVLRLLTGLRLLEYDDELFVFGRTS